MDILHVSMHILLLLVTIARLCSFPVLADPQFSQGLMLLSTRLGFLGQTRTYRSGPEVLKYCLRVRK